MTRLHRSHRCRVGVGSGAMQPDMIASAIVIVIHRRFIGCLLYQFVIAGCSPTIAGRQFGMFPPIVGGVATKETAGVSQVAERGNGDDVAAGRSA